MTTSKLDMLVSGPIGAFSVAPKPAIASPWPGGNMTPSAAIAQNTIPIRAASHDHSTEPLLDHARPAWRASQIPDTGPNKVRPGTEDDQCENGAESSRL